jgi:hypothetical protein
MKVSKDTWHARNWEAWLFFSKSERSRKYKLGFITWAVDDADLQRFLDNHADPTNAGGVVRRAPADVEPLWQRDQRGAVGRGGTREPVRILQVAVHVLGRLQLDGRDSHPALSLSH